MKANKDHLDINLEFLDKKESHGGVSASYSQRGQATSTKSTVSNDSKFDWKSILGGGKVILGVILFFAWAIFSGGNSDTNTNSSYAPSTNNYNLTAETGQTYRCSDSNYNRAMQLKPNASLGAQLANESDTLDTQIAANKAEGAAIEGMYVDEYDEYAVINYNNRVNRYNAERQRLITAMDSWEQRRKPFDDQVDTYNNFLDTNCTPQ